MIRAAKIAFAESVLGGGGSALEIWRCAARGWMWMGDMERLWEKAYMNSYNFT
jgi:hypothetical protein